MVYKYYFTFSMILCVCILILVLFFQNNKTYNQFEGISFTAQELSALKRILRNTSSNKDIALLQKKYNPLLINNIKENAFWHYSFPTVGLAIPEKPLSIEYPYLPHFFSLWDLASRRGAGVTIVLLDTGVAAFKIKNDVRYHRHQDLNIEKKDMRKGILNLVHKKNNDIFEKLIQAILKQCNDAFDIDTKIKMKLVSWLYDYSLYHDTRRIQSFLTKYGKPDFVDNTVQLTEKGKQALNEIIYGKNGIAPFLLNAHVTFKQLLSPFKMHIIEEFLPIPSVTTKKTTYIAGHGSHVFGLLKGQGKGIYGLAPNAHVIMIKAFNDEGVSDKATLCAGIQLAHGYKADILNLSLKIADALDVTSSHAQQLKESLNSIQYVIAAVGNHGDSQKKPYAGNTISYPARFDTVTFSVGAFGYENDTFFVPKFSQYEKEIGPHVLAPGVNILSAGLIPDQKEESMYIFLDGTSMASTMISGFIALMLGEFKNDFSKEELLKVCYSSAFTLSNDDKWRNKSLFGILDMRTALFILHVLRQLKTYANTMMHDTQRFDSLLHAIHYLLTWYPNQYCIVNLKEDNFFKNNFIAYWQYIQKDHLLNKDATYFNFFKQLSLKEAVAFVSSVIHAAIKNKKKLRYISEDAFNTIKLLVQ